MVYNKLCFSGQLFSSVQSRKIFKGFIFILFQMKKNTAQYFPVHIMLKMARLSYTKGPFDD